MAIEPAAISAKPAVTMMPVVPTAPDKPAASAKGTVNPSDIPMTMSRTVSDAVKCRSMCGVCGMLFSVLLFYAGNQKSYRDFPRCAIMNAVLNLSRFIKRRNDA